MAKGRMTINFNGVDSSAFNFYLTDFDPLILPQDFDQYVETPYLDGSHLFPGKLKDRIIPVSGIIECGRQLDKINATRQGIAAWLNVAQRAPLIFSSDPTKMFLAKPGNSVAMGFRNILDRKPIQMTFRADPFVYGTVEQDQAISVTGKVTNAGTQIVEPLIILTVANAVANVTVTNTTTGESFSITSMQSAGTVIEVDSGYITKKTCKINGANGLGKLSGKFLTLAPGDNQLTISNSNVTAEIKFRPKWL